MTRAILKEIFSMPQPQIQPPRSTSRYILTALAMIIVITAFILIGLNALQLEQRFSRISYGSVPFSGMMNGYRNGFMAARTKYQTICPMANQAVHALTGKIVDVSSDSLTIEQTSLVTDPDVDGISDTRTITLTPQTEIIRLQPKTPEQLSAEQANFIATMKTGKPTTPPSPVMRQVLTTKDLQIGQTVTIQSSMADIRLETNFPALVISVQP